MRLANRKHDFPGDNPLRISQSSFAVLLLAPFVFKRRRLFICLAVVLAFTIETRAQSTASIEGVVRDQHNAVVPAVQISASSHQQGVTRLTFSDDAGRFEIAALPVGPYDLEVRQTGFQTQIIKELKLEVGRRVTQDFQLQAGDIAQTVSVTPSNYMIQSSTVSVGHVVSQAMVQELPLNGRYFLDLGLLVPGSVT